MVHHPAQGGGMKPRRVRTVCSPFVRETSAIVVGKFWSGKSCLSRMAIAGRMTVARGVRSDSAKPDARVERMETAAMRINFIIGRM